MDELNDIMAVNGPEILEIERFEEIAPGMQGRLLLGNFEQIFFHGTDIRIYRNAVVIEDHQQVGLVHAGIVQGFHSHPACHGCIADDGDMQAVVIALQARCNGHTKSC